jgi:hypothetical protein
MSVGAPMPAPEELAPLAAPKLTGEPRIVERPSRFTAATADSERARLDMLVTLASLEVDKSPVSKEPTPTRSAKPPLTTASIGGLPLPPLPAPTKKPVASVPPPVSETPSIDETDTASGFSERMTGGIGAGWRTAWAQAPAYDEDHPEEMTYRPFPVTPFLTESPSFDDPALAQMTHPDSAGTLALLEDEGSALPMRLRPGRQAAGLVWAQEFRGEAVNLADLEASPAPEAARTLLAEKRVRTSQR